MIDHGNLGRSCLEKMPSNSSNPGSSSKLKASEVGKAPQASTKGKTIRQSNYDVSRSKECPRYLTGLHTSSTYTIPFVFTEQKTGHSRAWFCAAARIFVRGWVSVGVDTFRIILRFRFALF